jgi:hypothetical protein
VGGVALLAAGRLADGRSQAGPGQRGPVGALVLLLLAPALGCAARLAPVGAVGAPRVAVGIAAVGLLVVGLAAVASVAASLWAVGIGPFIPPVRARGDTVWWIPRLWHRVPALPPSWDRAYLS